MYSGLTDTIIVSRDTTSWTFSLGYTSFCNLVLDGDNFFASDDNGHIHHYKDCGTIMNADLGDNGLCISCNI